MEDTVENTVTITENEYENLLIDSIELLEMRQVLSKVIKHQGETTKIRHHNPQEDLQKLYRERRNRHKEKIEEEYTIKKTLNQTRPI